MSGSRPVFVKTCGMRTQEAVEVAVDAGADAIGFILAPSKRQVRIAEVVAIRDALARTHTTLPLPPFVGVTVNPSAEQIAAIAESGAFDAIQLSGDEARSITSQIPASLAIWKGLRPGPDDSAESVLQAVGAWLDDTDGRPADHILLDAYHPGAYGGTGLLGDWSLAAAAAQHYPIMLAGGLTPENVANAIAQVQPFGVDAASGMESDDVKDPTKVEAFIRNAKHAS